MQTLIYAGQHMTDNRQLMEYHVPPVSHMRHHFVYCYFYAIMRCAFHTPAQDTIDN